MQSVPDFLSLDDRVSYLEENGYAPAGGVSDSVRDALRFINFHHFLGYARNYRNMIRKGLVEGDVSLDRLLVVIELDRRASALIFRGLQLLEWHLRALFVEHHCALFSTTQCLFEQSHYTNTALDEEPAEWGVARMLDSFRWKDLRHEFDIEAEVQCRVRGRGGIACCPVGSAEC